MRVVTINTWKGDGPYRRRMELLAEQLHALEPDVVALQESLHTHDGAHSTHETLAEALEMNAGFAPARDKRRVIEDEPHASWSGLAVLSRWPITPSPTLELPADPEDGERVAQSATLDTPHGTVALANTHLTHLRTRDDLRCEQLRVILEAMPPAEEAEARLLCGDLNARPGSPAIEYLVRGDHGWDARHAWTQSQRLTPHATLSERNSYVRDGLGAHTIDYIWTLARSPRKQPRLVETCIVLDEADEHGFHPSDHFGVMAEFEL